MKVNWKEVAASPGYKKIKQHMIDALNDNHKTIQKGHRPMRDKAEYYKYFRGIIARAQHYAIKENVSLIDVLNKWAEGQSYNWLSYYSNYNFPKKHSNSCKPKGIRAKRKYNNRFFVDSRNDNCRAIDRIQKAKSRRQGKKSRWSVEDKKRRASYRKWLQQ